MKKKQDIKGHVLLLKHTKLSEQASQNLLKKYNILKEQLPVIFNKDTGVVDLDVEPGDIVEVTRESPTIGNSKYYRVVVNA
ncbi:MAG: DNA-directed RNA polymerase subunit H [Nanoarchaeota archaeon]|nr:DNA-directed RNA polymerase subunit H [Nanoarchaeota archaeon]|tara:strand:- start:978 stop:1220 length:243 start_codon:yes stop_codon:yes gene_type:complete